jgi:hypothetical protein
MKLLAFTPPQHRMEETAEQKGSHSFVEQQHIATCYGWRKPQRLIPDLFNVFFTRGQRSQKFHTYGPNSMAPLL